MNKIQRNKFWCLITARSGSKGLKNKNILKIQKYPLFIHSFLFAKKIKKISKIYLSTDSKNYIKILKKYNFNNYRLRPNSIAQDNSKDIEVFKDFVKFIVNSNLKLPEFIIHFRPTTPIRNLKTVNKAINVFFKNKKKYSSLKSISEETKCVQKNYVINSNKLKTLLGNDSNIDKVNIPRQNFNKTYFGNNIIDIYKTTNILSGTLYGKSVYPFLIKNDISIDIDNKSDIDKIRLIFKKSSKNAKISN